MAIHSPETDEENDFKEFLYVISHDFRAPLRHIREFTKLLEKNLGDALDDTNKEYMQIIQGAVQSMDDMLEALLQYSRYNTEEREIQPVSLNDIVQNVITQHQQNCDDIGAKIEAQNLPTITGNTALLTTLFDELIQNAVKFRDESRPLEIIVKAQNDQDAWHITVSDNGRGMDENALKNTLVIFRKCHTDNIGGLGVGLAFCKKIMALHDGKIWIESEERKGTTVHLIFPAL